MSVNFSCQTTKNFFTYDGALVLVLVIYLIKDDKGRSIRSTSRDRGPLVTKLKIVISDLKKRPQSVLTLNLVQKNTHRPKKENRITETLSGYNRTHGHQGNENNH